MKALLKYTIFIAAITISLMLITFQIANLQMNDNIDTDMLLTSINNKSSDSNDLTLQQLRAQISFFRQAIDALGTTSALQVAHLWAKAEETRNGVFRYAVACNNLKYQLVNEWGEPEQSFWNIGVSSPWLSKYELLDIRKLNDTTFKITVKYYWATSTGPTEPTYETLTIIKTDDYWCVKEVS